jgi:hypothetical protein
MTLLANVDTTTVFMKETLRIEYAIRNDSTSTVKAVEINIKKIEQFHARHHAKALTSSIYKQVWSFFIFSYVDCFGYLLLGCSVISVSFIICMLTLLLVPLAGLNLFVGLDFATFSL